MEQTSPPDSIKRFREKSNRWARPATCLKALFASRRLVGTAARPPPSTQPHLDGLEGP